MDRGACWGRGSNSSALRRAAAQPPCLFRAARLQQALQGYGHQRCTGAANGVPVCAAGRSPHRLAGHLVHGGQARQVSIDVHGALQGTGGRIVGGCEGGELKAGRSHHDGTRKRQAKNTPAQRAQPPCVLHCTAHLYLQEVPVLHHVDDGQPLLKALRQGLGRGVWAHFGTPDRASTHTPDLLRPAPCCLSAGQPEGSWRRRLLTLSDPQTLHTVTPNQASTTCPPQQNLLSNLERTWRRMLLTSTICMSFMVMSSSLLPAPASISTLQRAVGSRFRD